jgi:uncharacterized phage protein (TIGR02218 family)
MKAFTGSLATFLAGTKSIVYADLYAITLLGGTVLRWTSADLPITFGGYYYSCTPLLTDQGLKSQRGVQVDNIEVRVDCDANTTANGVPFLTFVRAAGLDGALISITRVMGPDWTSAFAGSYNRFTGRISQVKDLSKTGVSLVCNSWLELLSVNMPPDIISASCINTLFGPGCGLSKATYAASGTVGSGTNGVTTFSSNLTTHGASYYDLGHLVFTSGPNNGLVRTIKSQDASGNLTLVTPLAGAPSNGNTFTAYPGCHLTQSECSSKFANLANFRGFPYVPPPETAI